MYDYLTISRNPARRLAAIGRARSTRRWPSWPALADDAGRRRPAREPIAAGSRRSNGGSGNRAGSESTPPRCRAIMATAASWWPTSQAICDCLAADYGELLATSEARRWLHLTRTFGLHMTRLDIRQDARRYQEVLTEILQALGASDDFAALDDAGRVAGRWPSTIDFAGEIPPQNLGSANGRHARSCIGVMQRAMVRFGPSCLGANVISLTRSASRRAGRAVAVAACAGRRPQAARRTARPQRAETSPRCSKRSATWSEPGKRSRRCSAIRCTPNIWPDRAIAR